MKNKEKPEIKKGPWAKSREQRANRVVVDHLSSCAKSSLCFGGQSCCGYSLYQMILFLHRNQLELERKPLPHRVALSLSRFVALRLRVICGSAGNGGQGKEVPGFSNNIRTATR